MARLGSHGHHRVKVPDVLIAASADVYGIPAVLHYDQQFDKLQTVLHCDSVWLAPRGSVGR